MPAPSLRTIKPRRLLDKRHAHLIDVRPAGERRGELGFIPGSLSAPTQDALKELLELWPAGERIVLVCMSGRRSEAIARALIERGDTPHHIRNLTGGLLAWLADELPVASHHVEDRAALTFKGDASAFKLAMRACFIGEVVEVIVERELDADPLTLLDTSTQLARLYQNGASIEERMVDFAGYVSWQVGTSPEHIARNMTWALANKHLLRAEDTHNPTAWTDR